MLALKELLNIHEYRGVNSENTSPPLIKNYPYQKYPPIKNIPLDGQYVITYALSFEVERLSLIII